MLHYNYSAPLSFLSSFGGDDSSAVSRDVDDGNSREDLSTRYMSPGAPSTPNGQSSNKSFTIAAILGLKNDEKPTDLTVVNLSVHQGVADRISDCRSRLLPGGLVTARPTVYQRPLGVTNLGRTPNKKSGLSSNHGPMGASTGGGKSKRVRTIFTPEQLERLEAEFERQQYMVGPERLYLAHTLQLTEAQVKVWFQNRRIKWRKHHLEVTQQRLAAIKQRQFITAATGVPSSPPLQPDVMDADESSSETDS